MDGDWKGRNLTNPLLFISEPHKGGQFFKVLSLTNCHNFSNGNRSFSITRKGGMPHVFWELFNKSWQKLSKKYDNHPFVATKTIQLPPKIVMIWWWLKIFSCDTLSHFDHPLVAIKIFWSPQDTMATIMFFSCHKV